MNPEACRLSAIIAQIDPAVSLDPAIAAWRRSCRGIPAEIVVVQTTACPPVAQDSGEIPVTVVRAHDDALVPQLWAAGLARARGEFVAFTLANCVVADSWVRSVIEALEAGASGVAGPIACAPGVGIVDRAIYYLRYSGFIPARVGDAVVAGEIPGDNAAYPRAALVRHRDAIADGFWEVVYHRRVRAEGGQLWTRRAASAHFSGGVRLGQALRHRLAHGRHFGAWRVAQGLRRRWQIVVASPAVPWLLAARVASRVLGSAEDSWRMLVAAPVVVLIASSWALGEALGAVGGFEPARSKGER